MTEHDFQQARFTGNLCCTRCSLVPLDIDDINTPCNDPTLNDADYREQIGYEHDERETA